MIKEMKILFPFIIKNGSAVWNINNHILLSNLFAIEAGFFFDKWLSCAEDIDMR